MCESHARCVRLGTSAPYTDCRWSTRIQIGLSVNHTPEYLRERGPDDRFRKNVPVTNSAGDHRLRGSASTVLTATGQVNGRWRILTPHRIETHEPTATKFRTFDYVSEGTP